MADFFAKYRLYLLMTLVNVAVLIGVVFVLRRDEPRELAITTPLPRPTPTIAMVAVQIGGAVREPGVYSLPAAARVSDVLELAGGLLQEGDTAALNLARRVKDGEAILVPTRVPTPTIRPTGTPTELPTATAIPTQAETRSSRSATLAFPTPRPVSPSPRARININTATLAQLDTLPHIGPALAQRIIDYRLQNGPFQKIEDVKLVKGIGDAIFLEIQDLITVEGQ